MSIFIQNLIQSFRALRTQGWQVAISSISIAVSIVCFAFSANWYWAESHFDSFRPNYRQSYVLQNYKEKYNFTLGYHSYRELNELRQAVGDNAFKLGIMRSGQRKVFSTEDGAGKHKLMTSRLDTTMAHILGLEAVHGDIEMALADVPGNIIITDDIATRLFGRTDVIGERIYMESDSSYLSIKAVCRANTGPSHFEYDAFFPLSPSVGEMTSYDYQSFVALIQTEDAEATLKRLQSFVRPEGHDNSQATLQLSPLRTYHKMYPQGVAFEKPHTYFDTYFYPIVFSLVSLLLILCAAVNFVMAQASIWQSRLREYSLRRCTGATAWQNLAWLYTGLLPTLLLAALLAGIGMEWLVRLTDAPWDMFALYPIYGCTLLGTLLLCLVGMLVPAWRMRQAYRNSFLGHNSRGDSHAWLIVVQFAACLFMLFVSLSMQRQIYGMTSGDMGYKHDNMLRLHTQFSKYQLPEGYENYFDFSNIYADLPQEFLREKGAGITDVLAMPSDIFNRFTQYGFRIIDEANFPNRATVRFGEDVPDLNLQIVEIPYRAIDFFQISTQNGIKLRQEDERGDELRVYLNREAQEMLAPSGKMETDYYVISRSSLSNSVGGGTGEAHWLDKRINVVDFTNLRVTDYFSKGSPIMFLGVEENHKCEFLMTDAIYIKYEPGRRRDAEAAVHGVLARFDVPADQYLLCTMDEYIADVYRKESFLANLLSSLTAFSIIITFAGVVSMLLHSLRLRRRSMAIHRIMGAEFRDIFRPTLRPYLLCAILGAVIAYFPATILINKWMEYFHYGEAPGVGMMLGILLGMVVLITLIVWWQVRWCMREKPMEILQPES